VNIPQVTFIIALLCLLSAGGCGKRLPKQEQKPERPVHVAQAIVRDVPIYREEIGHCVASETVTVQPQVAGAIVAIHFEDGAEVKKGDRLFSIDPRPYHAALAKAKATLAQNKAKAVDARSQATRREELSKKNVIPQQEYESFLYAAEAAEATVQADEAAVLAAQIDLERCEILSPIDGRTSKRMSDVGNVVTPNATPLLLIQRQDPMYVDFTVVEKDLPEIRKFWEKGTLKAEVSFADDPSKRREAVFSFLDSGVQQSSGRIWARARLENADRLFWPGQFVQVRLLLDTIEDAVLVPAEAVQVGQAGPFVFVVKDDKTVELRKVKPGQKQDGFLVIEEGLASGETVVVTGQISLSPGASVKIVPREDSP